MRGGKKEKKKDIMWKQMDIYCFLCQSYRDTKRNLNYHPYLTFVAEQTAEEQKIEPTMKSSAV